MLPRFIPQEEVLGSVAAVVCHAGFGTIYGALSVGVPLVVAPLAADQPVCAMGRVSAGAAVSLASVPAPEQFLAYVTDPAAVTAAQVGEATTRVLEDPAYRQAARRIAAEMAAAPPPASLVPWLMSLAGQDLSGQGSGGGKPAARLGDGSQPGDAGDPESAGS
jgi:UDP:flavonoid glycosyltransferase YjiC (YdhE family)